jgi:hypothetical protein
MTNDFFVIFLIQRYYVHPVRDIVFDHFLYDDWFEKRAKGKSS